MLCQICHKRQATLYCKPIVNRFRRTTLLLTGLALLTLIVSGAACSKRSTTPPIVFGHVAAPTATNASFVAVTVSNLSDSVIVYLACPAEVRSNGIWSGSPFPKGQRMTSLAAGQSGVLVIEAASVKENVRVPVLWGFIDYTPRASRWRQMGEAIMARVKGHGSIGLLYTNYLTNLKP